MQRFFYPIIMTFLHILPAHSQNLTITCPHKTLPLKVELAQTPLEQEKGLMYRTSLPEDGGMLFLYSQPQSLAMWMKNTFLSLDMIFCDEKGNILAIHEKASPLSLNIIGPVENASKVLEIRGGMVESEGITKTCTLTLNR